ncbi:hypothetical protein EUAN_09110 [Andreesenia angusta]|uniref:Uncharacterized protein n=1 Tax=Andreesenia angusta TaxID=39480 RepID=A0A1S1VAF9_9FIRM|nr:hypothetical protein [Andreesenia angusta]OHW63127.1 hypothetical protein EUAN_09110 [Andreesenia angusta]
MDLTDSLFKSLMAKDKIFEETPNLPSNNQKAQFQVSSLDGRDKFIVDIDRRGKIEMKSKLQERYAGNQVLVRIDANSPPHTNPDSTTTS